VKLKIEHKLFAKIRKQNNKFQLVELMLITCMTRIKAKIRIGNAECMISAVSNDKLQRQNAIKL